MGKLVELWRSPYPTFYQRWKAVVIPSAIIFLILYILQPFGISRIKGSVFGVVAGSALIAAGASGVFTYLLPALFPAYYKEQNWTLGKHVLNLLLMLLLIAVGDLGLSIMVDGNVVGQAVVLSGFVLGNGAGTFSYHIFSDVEP